jgi:hypothetical protein
MSFWGCVGGEVRGHFTVSAHLQADDQVVWQPMIKLYEGTSCSSNDLDGWFQGRARTLKPNYYQQNVRINTWNSAEDERLDWVWVTYEVHHDA